MFPGITQIPNVHLSVFSVH